MLPCIYWPSLKIRTHSCTCFQGHERANPPGRWKSGRQILQSHPIPARQAVIFVSVNSLEQITRAHGKVARVWCNWAGEQVAHFIICPGLLDAAPGALTLQTHLNTSLVSNALKSSQSEPWRIWPVLWCPLSQWRSCSSGAGPIRKE